ncbi:MAG: ParB N-terminal domain-containing protein [Flavobacteriales bacterium]
MIKLQSLKRSRSKISLHALCTDDSFFTYSKQEAEHAEGFTKTIRDRGQHLPIIAIRRDGKLYIVDGRFRVEAILEAYGENHLVDVEIIEDELTLEEIQWLIADLGKKRKLRYQDYVNLYFLYHQLVPNQQGKKDVDEDRHKLIASHIGVSTSQLSKLLRINRVDPFLITELDHGVTMQSVMTTVKKMEEEADAKRKDQEEEKESTTTLHNTHHKDRVVDLDAVPNCCAACNRPYDVKWEDIPVIFNVGRDETNDQEDWLKND